MKVDWRELRSICLIVGCVESRQKGDHLVMTRSGMARPIVIKMDSRIGEDIIRTNMQTLGIKRPEFERLLNQVRRIKHARLKTRKPN